MAPTGLFNRLKGYYSKDPEKDVPAITPQAAAVLSILYTLLYVLPLYVSPTSRPSTQLSRDAPSVIRARIRAVTFSCIVSTAATFYVIATWGHASPLEAVRLLGYWPVSVGAIGKSFTLTALLFAGPLFEKGIVEGGWKDWTRGEQLGEVFGSWIGWRNFVAGPITEEIVFRSTIIPPHILAKTPPDRMVFLTPLYFGIAHVHHFYEYKLTHPHTPLLPALLRVVIQFAYTSVFGFFASFVFLRTGSLPAVVLVHSFCNLCGLPRLWGRVEAGVPIGPPLRERDNDKVDRREGGSNSSGIEAKLRVGNGSLGIGWTIAYYLLLFAGAIGFWKTLWTLTESETQLVSFSRAT
ncbi:MAG: hypothetical protein M1838_006064 [Thelocarpon superellum]|nr:MAG: hypothetical protein M1838_006064 [Thelocarpon superellum]